MNPKTNKTILITGTSSGFGLLIASRLASSGHTVFATMRDLNKQRELLTEVKKRGGDVRILQLDVTNKESIKTALNQVLKSSGTIDVVINNAGYGVGGFFEDLEEEEIRAQMETNFFGVQNVCREIIPHMRKQGSGRIINISSVAGLQTTPCFSAYNASKWALEGFSESLRYELSFFGIDVLLVEPGTYKTRIFHENARYAKNFNNQESPYYRLSQFLKQRTLNYVDGCKKDPENVAKLVEKLVLAKNPPFRNIPDMEGQTLFFLRKILPFKLYSRLIKKALFSGYRP